MQRLQDLREAKEEEKDVEMIRLYAEDGELVPEILQETAEHLVDKAVGEELKFVLD